MWRLDRISSASFTYNYIAMRLDSGIRNVNYILGKSGSVTYTNSSSQCFYYVDGFNLTGIWTNLFRNVSNDVYSAFGINDWNITQIGIISYSNNPNSGTSFMSIQLDFLYPNF